MAGSQLGYGALTSYATHGRGAARRTLAPHTELAGGKKISQVE